MIDPILGNLQLRLTNLHIRYEDEGSYPGHRLCLGLLLRKVSAHSVDEAGRKAFVTANALQCLRKVGRRVMAGTRSDVLLLIVELCCV